MRFDELEPGEFSRRIRIRDGPGRDRKTQPGAQNDANMSSPRTMMSSETKLREEPETDPDLVEHTKREPIVARLSFRRCRGAGPGVFPVSPCRTTRALAAPRPRR